MSRKNKKEKDFITLPQYPGGQQALQKFIAENLRYPGEALEKQIEGTVHVVYTVNNEGMIEDVAVSKGIGFGCDEEAVRIIHMLRYEPAHNRGMRVRSSMRTRINFRLPAAPAPVLNYQISQKKEKQKPAVKPAGELQYGYTITFNTTLPEN